MNIFSVRTLIDDILLIVRNNNISESEDLSRDQIRAWIMAYKAQLAKKQKDKDETEGNEEPEDESSQKTIGPLNMRYIEDPDGCEVNLKRTISPIPNLLDDSDENIVSVRDARGCIFQVMSKERRHIHFSRRYTWGEPICYYEDGYLYIEGDVDNIHNLYLTAEFADDGDGDDVDEDDINIPGWMIPDIKKNIMNNELAFMLKRPSDDSNNSTLASVKPHGPQDAEK